MPTFALPRFLESDESRVEHARQLEQAVRATGGDLKDVKLTGHTAADSKTLRGIPAIGRGVAGVIAGTQPESVVTSRASVGRPSVED
jgi:hypothetical protein